jgi:hypothetical protein
MLNQSQTLGDLFDKTGKTTEQIARELGATTEDVEAMRRERVERDAPGISARIGSLMRITQKYRLEPGRLGAVLEPTES